MTTSDLSCFRRIRTRVAFAALVALAVACLATPASAQRLEIAAFGGYRFGNDFFELVAGRDVDRDGAPSVGAAIDIPLELGLLVEALYSFQQTVVEIPSVASADPTSARVTVQHWLGGALQEFGTGRARPFVAGHLGLTRVDGAGESEVRFTLAGGGGLKLDPTPRIGLRLDGRVTTTFVDAEAFSTGPCAPAGCPLRLNLTVAWQIELTAGVVFRF